MGDIQPSLDFAKDAGIPVIEDSAIALGASYRKRMAGSIGDAGVFSLQDSKMISSWRGGVVTTSSSEMRDFLAAAREKQEKIAKPKAAFNIAFSAARRVFSRPWAYGLTMYSLKRIMTSERLNPVLGSIMNFNPTEAIDGVSPKDMPAPDNARYTELQAAVALASLKRVSSIVRKRRRIAKAIVEGLDGSGVIVPDTPKGAEHSYGRMPIRIEGAGKFRVASMLLKRGIETAVNYPYICPDTEHFSGCRLHSDFRNARKAALETLLLPMHTKLNGGDVERIVSATREVAKLL